MLRPAAALALVALAACGGERPAVPPDAIDPPADPDAAPGGTGGAPGASPDDRAPAGEIPSPEIPEVPDAPAPDAPRIEVRPASVDFGFVLYRKAYERELLVANTGTAPATIEHVHLAEGSSERYSLEAPATVELAPGAETALLVRYDAAELSVQPDRAEMRFDAAGSTHAVPITGFASAPCLRIEPNPVEFGRVPDGYLPVKSINITNCGVGPAVLESVTLEPASCGVIRGEPTRGAVLPAGNLLALTIVPDPDAPLPCDLLLHFTDLPTQVVRILPWTDGP